MSTSNGSRVQTEWPWDQEDPYPWPPKTYRSRQFLIAAILWELELNGDITDSTNASGELRKKLIERGVDIGSDKSFQNTISDLCDDSRWGTPIRREVTGKRTRAIRLNKGPLPPNPFKPPPYLVLPTEDSMWAAEHPYEDGIKFHNGKPVTDEEVERLVPEEELGQVARRRGLTREQVAVHRKDLEEHTVNPIVSTDDSNWQMPDLPDVGDAPVDKLLMATRLINEAILDTVNQTASDPEASHEVIAERLASTLTALDSMRKKLRTAEDTAMAYKRRADDLARINRTMQANLDALTRTPKLDDRAHHQLDRMVREKPNTGVRSRD